MAGATFAGQPIVRTSVGFGFEFGRGPAFGAGGSFAHRPFVDGFETLALDDLLLGVSFYGEAGYHGRLSRRFDVLLDARPYVGFGVAEVKPFRMSWQFGMLGLVGLRYRIPLHGRAVLGIGLSAGVDPTAPGLVGQGTAVLLLGRPKDPLYGDPLPPTGLVDWTDTTHCKFQHQRHCPIDDYDVIAVLGCPSEADGSPSACQVERIDDALDFQREGHGHRFIVSGGAVGNDVVEAETMRAMLIDHGVAMADVYVDAGARHTDENILGITRIMKVNGWVTAALIGHAKQILYSAVCDANCCVRQGRLAPVAYTVGRRSLIVGSYVLAPPGDPVTEKECLLLEEKSMCRLLESREACVQSP